MNATFRVPGRRSRAHEVGLHEPGSSCGPIFGPAFEALLSEFERDRERVLRDAGDRYWRAIMLALDLETCEALLRGEDVPLSRLDPVWVRRFGLRSAA